MRGLECSFLYIYVYIYRERDIERGTEKIEKQSNPGAMNSLRRKVNIKTFRF